MCLSTASPEVDAGVEHRLGGAAPRGVTTFSNSEYRITVDGGSGGAGVSLASYSGLTVRRVKGPKCRLSVNLGRRLHSKTAGR